MTHVDSKKLTKQLYYLLLCHSSFTMHPIYIYISPITHHSGVTLAKFGSAGKLKVGSKVKGSKAGFGRAGGREEEVVVEVEMEVEVEVGDV